MDKPIKIVRRIFIVIYITKYIIKLFAIFVSYNKQCIIKNQQSSHFIIVSVIEIGFNECEKTF
jgi:hypothetical protein